MDSNVEAAMVVVYKCDGTTIKFKEFENGLYYHDAALGVTSSNTTNLPITLTPLTMVSSILRNSGSPIFEWGLGALIPDLDDALVTYSPRHDMMGHLMLSPTAILVSLV